MTRAGLRRERKKILPTWTAVCLASLAAAWLFSAPIEATDSVWKTVVLEGVAYDVHVVSNSPLGVGFPNRDLRYAVDAGWATDIYVVRQNDGSPVALNLARNVVTLLQSSFKYPAGPANTLSPNEGIHPVDSRDISTSYPLLTSSYFSNFFVNTFLTGGAVGLDNANHRADIYEEIFFDMALQPDLADRPGGVQRLQTLLDRVEDDSAISNAFGPGISAFRSGGTGTIPWSNYQAALAAIESQISRLVDMKTPSGTGSPLELLSDVLDEVDTVQAITGAAARVMLLEALALEVGNLRLRVLEDYVDRVVAGGSADPALVQGFAQASDRINSLTGDYFDKLPEFISGALAEDPVGVLHLDKLSKYIVQRWLGKKAATSFGRAALPWILSYKTYKGIRRQQDRAQTASVALTLQDLLFEANGLAHKRSLVHSGGTVDANELQEFAELYQMSWYLSARHYQDTLNTLNNKLSRVFGLGIDIFTGGGAPYSEQMGILRSSLNYRRMATHRIAPPSYLAIVSDFRTASPQDAEFPWLMQLVRDHVVGSPSAVPAKLLDLCITLPFNAAGTDATLAGMNIRFEPRSCSDPTGSQDWECGDNDPDGECTARAQLFWDDDTNSSNADCANGSGPCPINGAEDLNPRRGLFYWNPAADGLSRASYYIFARVGDADDSSETYSSGFYRFIDPIKEGDHWSVAGVAVSEGARSDGDGIPEIGEEIDIVLSIENDSGRTLSGVKIDDLRLEGDPVRFLTNEDWDESIAANREMTHVFDDTVLAPDAAPGQTAEASDDLNVWIGENSDTSIGFIASINYDDPGNPIRPDLRRVQEVDFTAVVSDGTDGPQFRCDSTRVVDDTDMDGVFESGERGKFKVDLCNDGTWEANGIVMTFQSPPPLGVWKDEDSPFSNLSPGVCLESLDDFSLELDRTECGTLNLVAEVRYNGAQTQTGIACSIDVTCAPYQSLQDEKEAGVVPVGDTLATSVGIHSTGATPLLISNVVEKNGASDTTVTGFPGALAPGTSGTIQVEIDTTGLAPGSYSRTLLVSSNANNLSERESIIFFGVSAGGGAQQLTTNGIATDPNDIDGDLAVFTRSNNIYAVDVRSLQEIPIATTSQEERRPRISGERVVFHRRDAVSGEFDVYLFDLGTGIETRITDLAQSQSDADIRGDQIVWEDRRAGAQNADIYGYQIGAGSTNGTLLVDLGSNVSAEDPRVEDDYIGFIRRVWSDPNTSNRDFGYKDRSTGTVYPLGLDSFNPCRPGNRFDIFGNHLAFECDCGSACDSDDQIYYVDMDGHSAPVRLTCDPGFTDDREQPSILGNEVLYTRDGDDDIYKVAIGGACQTEVPMQVRAGTQSEPAAEPRTGSYVFGDTQTGARELWGVIPPPAVEAGISGFDLDPGPYLQNESTSLFLEVTNYGSQGLANLSVRVTDDGATIFETVIASLASGGSATVDGTWDRTASSVGVHTLVAMLDPAPTGDADPTNNSDTLTPAVEDDDTSPPSISGIDVAPAPSGDGDSFLEAGEAVEFTWTATDSAGIASTHVTLAALDYAGTEGSPNDYSATAPSPGVGEHQALFSATDADDSPETKDPPVPISFTVYPAFPEVLGTTPANGATGVDPRSDVSVQFSVEMDAASLDPQSLTLEGPGGEPVAAAVGYDAGSSTAVLQPTSALSPNTHYTGRVVSGSVGVRDVRQNVLPTDFLWSFDTGEGVGACGAPDVVAVSHQSLNGIHTIEACEEITVGADVAVGGEAVVVLRAPRVVFLDMLSIASGADVTIDNVEPTP